MPPSAGAQFLQKSRMSRPVFGVTSMPQADAPDLAVIIPHYNDLERLARCLDALAPQLAAAAGAVEAVVADNASPGDVAGLVARHPGLRLVTEPRKGAAAARNRGVAETRAPRLAFLDCDCVPAADWLDAARRLAGSAGVIGGRIDTFDETPPPRSGAEAFEAVFAFDQRRYIERKGFSVTANLLTTRAVFEDVGPLIVGLSEDIEWCLRATAKGHALIYAEDLRVRHPTRQDWPAIERKWRRTTAEMFQLHGTRPARRLLWALRAGAVFASGPVHLPRVARAPALSDAGERWRAAAMLLRLRATRAVWMLGQAWRGH